MDIQEILLEASGINVRKEVIDLVNSFPAEVPSELEPILYNLALEAVKFKYREEPPIYKEHRVSQDQDISAAITDLAERLNIMFSGQDVDIVVADWSISYMFAAELLHQLEFDFKIYSPIQYSTEKSENHVILVSYETSDVVRQIEHNLNRHAHDITNVYLVGNNTKRMASAVFLTGEDESDLFLQGFGKPDQDGRYGEIRHINLIERL